MIPGDLLASTLTSQVSYRLYQARPMQLPTNDDIISSGPVNFTSSGKKSLRINNGPDLELTCYGTADGIH